MSTKSKILDKIIDCINAGAGGRLVVFKPENSDKDLIVEKKGNYKNTSISLNIYTKDQLEKTKDLGSENNFYLVFANFDFVKQNIEDEIFVVSTLDFQKITMDKKDLGKFLIEQLDKKL